MVPRCFAVADFHQVAVFLMDTIHLCTQFCIQQSIQTRQFCRAEPRASQSTANTV